MTTRCGYRTETSEVAKCRRTSCIRYAIAGLPSARTLGSTTYCACGRFGVRLMIATDECRIGTAGWSIPRSMACEFPGDGTHLARYVRILRCAEINTSFYRSHRPEVYARWAAQTPSGFRFAVKVPREITHELRLRATRAALQRFTTDVSALGDRLGALLVQLPPSLTFEPRPVRTFFTLLASMFDGPIVCEPRHATWFEPAADRALIKLRVGRVAADPARWPSAAVPGGWLGPAGDGVGATVYHRWHGSPRMYFSAYEDRWLRERAEALRHWPQGTDCWSIFDNTASGAAASDALRLQARLQSASCTSASQPVGCRKGHRIG